MKKRSPLTRSSPLKWIQSKGSGFGRIDGGEARKKRTTPEQIIAEPREGKVALSQGKMAPKACRNLDFRISPRHTFFSVANSGGPDSLSIRSNEGLG